MKLESDEKFFIYSTIEAQTWVDPTDTWEYRNLEGVSLYKRVWDKLEPEYTFCTQVWEVPTLEEIIHYVKEIGIEKLYTSEIRWNCFWIDSYSALEYWSLELNELDSESREELEKNNIKVLYLLDI